MILFFYAEIKAMTFMQDQVFKKTNLKTCDPFSSLYKFY